MKKMSKRYKNILKRIDKTKKYDIDKALDITIKNANAKFDESIEVHLKTGIDVKQSNQQIRGTTILPHKIGKEKIVAVFAEAKKAEEAKEAGGDIVGGQDLIDKIKQTKQTEFDISVAVPDMMKKLVPIAKILGQRGLMPSPKTETVTTNIVETVKQLKKGKISFKNDNSGNIHQMVGKVSIGKNNLKENILSFIESVENSKSSDVKGEFIRGVYITSTMGIGIKVNLK